MFRILIYKLLLFILIIGSSCNNENSFDCFKTTGEIVELELTPGSFNRVEINDGMDIFLVNAPEEKVRIKGGENLISKVRIELDSGLLRLYNENTCNWTRNYDPIQVYISAPDFYQIYNFGFGKMVSLDTLKSDFLRLTIQYSAAEINLTIDTKILLYESNSISSTVLSGKTKTLHANHFYNDGIFNSENLDASIVNVLHKGYGSIRVRADSLSGTIERNGLLEYYSKSETSSVEIIEGSLVYLGL